MRNKKSVLMTGIVNCECSDGDVHGIAPNIKIVEGLASAEVLRTIGCYPKLSLSLNFGYGGRKIN